MLLIFSLSQSTRSVKQRSGSEPPNPSIGRSARPRRCLEVKLSTTTRVVVCRDVSLLSKETKRAWHTLFLPFLAFTNRLLPLECHQSNIYIMCVSATSTSTFSLCFPHQDRLLPTPQSISSPYAHFLSLPLPLFPILFCFVPYPISLGSHLREG